MGIKELKEMCCQANLELARKGLVVYTWGNVSQLDREKGIFVIKPSGVPYEELTGEMMVAVDVETGRALEDRYKPSSDTPTHVELYRAFEGIGGVTHTHSPAATAWAPFMPSGWLWVTWALCRARSRDSSREAAASAQGATRMAAPLP